jgi:hypothetical protein
MKLRVPIGRRPRRGEIVVQLDADGRISLDLRHCNFAVARKVRGMSTFVDTLTIDEGVGQVDTLDVRQADISSGVQITFDEAEQVAAALRDLALIVRVRHDVGFAEVA